MEDNKAAMVSEKEKAVLERRYSVRISPGALRAFDSMLIPEDTSARDVLDKACKLVMDKFIDHDRHFDLQFNERAYELRRAIVELVELCRSDHPEIKYWVARLRSERDAASAYMSWLLRRWDFGLNEIFNPKTKAELRLLTESTLEEPSDIPFNEASGFVQFLDDIQDQLIYCFRSLLTVEDFHVVEVLTELTDVPRTHIDTSMNDRYKKTAIYFSNRRVMDQGHVINEIFKILASERKTTTHRPRGSFLLLGPSRVGKTEIAKAVARHWYWDESRLVEIDMGEHVDPLEESAAGSKRVRWDVWGQLVEAVTKRPYSVIILDKIEKASSIFLSGLLDVLSYESAREIDGKTVDFSKSIIFITSDVGIDQLELPCTCYEQQCSKLPKHSRPNRMKFEVGHRCPLKDNGPERVIDKAKETLGPQLIGSLDKVLVVKRFSNKSAVGRLILRETVRDVCGEKFVVHASNEAIDVLFRKTSILDPEPGKTFRQALLDHVITKLPDTEECVNVYVDTLVGTDQLSLRFRAHNQKVGDSYFKLKDGTFDIFIAEMKRRVEAANRLFKLRGDCLGLFQSNASLYELKKLVLDARNEFATCSRGLDTFTLLTCIFKEIASCDGKLTTKEEMKTLDRHLIELKGEETGVGEATRTILGALVQTSDDALFESRIFPPRHYFFGGLKDDAKERLIRSLKKYLGESFFMYVRLDNNCRGEELKKRVVDRVKERPCMVLMLDRIEFADIVLYNSLLEILDKGTVEDESVDFRRMILILTSDVENKRGISMFPIFYQKPVVVSDDTAMNRDKNAKRFRTELLYRVEKVMFFDPVSEHGGTPFTQEYGDKYMKPFNELWLSRFLYAAFK